MRLLSTRTMAYEVAKQKNNDELGCEAQEEGHMRLLSTRTRKYEVTKQKNKDE